MSKEYDFISFCPVVGCGNANKPIYWSHYNCGGKTKINDRGWIRCTVCNTKGSVIEWLFKCEHHSFERANFQKICFVLAAVEQILEVDDDDFFMDMVDAVKVQYRQNKKLREKIKNEADFK